LLQGTTTLRENDQQYNDKSSGEDLGASDGTVSDGEDANKQSAGNVDTKLPEDVHHPGNGDNGTEGAGLEGVYNQEDSFVANSEEENKNTAVTHQVDYNESPGNLSAVFGGKGGSVSADSDGSRTTSSDLTTGVGAAGATGEPDDAQISTST
jgi:hypothetical protein